MKRGGWPGDAPPAQAGGMHDREQHKRAGWAGEVRGSWMDAVHLVVALDAETLLGGRHGEGPEHSGHLRELVPDGGAVFDAARKLDPGKAGRDDVRLYPIPFDDLLRRALREFGKEDQAGRLRVMANTIAVGASLALLEFPIEIFLEVIKECFKRRRAELGEMNARAALLAGEYVRQTCGHAFPVSLPQVEPPPGSS